MATNVLSLPQLPAANLAFSTNADWRYSWTFAAAGVPIDITGIAFRLQVRASAGAISVALDLSTVNGLLVNNGTTGVLNLAVLENTLKSVGPGSYVADLIAEGDGNTVNLFATNGPIVITATQGITTP